MVAVDRGHWSLSAQDTAMWYLKFPDSVGALLQEQVLPQNSVKSNTFEMGALDTVFYSACYLQEFTYIQKVGNML